MVGMEACHKDWSLVETDAGTVDWIVVEHKLELTEFGGTLAVNGGIGYVEVADEFVPNSAMPYT